MPTLLLSGYSSLGHSLPRFDLKTFRQPSRLPALVSTTFQVFKENNHLPALRITPQPYTDVFWMPAPMLGLISSGRQRLMLRMEHAPDTGHSKLILCLGGPAPPRRPAGRPRLIIDNPGPAARPRAHAEIIGVIARTTRAF